MYENSCPFCGGQFWMFEAPEDSYPTLLDFLKVRMRELDSRGLMALEAEIQELRDWRLGCEKSRIHARAESEKYFRAKYGDRLVDSKYCGPHIRMALSVLD